MLCIPFVYRLLLGSYCERVYNLHQKIYQLFEIKLQMEIEIEHSPLIIGYYPFRAKAQLMRLLCEYHHIPYQDRFFTPDEWSKFKETEGKKYILKDMPFIMHQGFMVCGIWAPICYIIELSNNYDLLGKTQKHRIRIDEIKNKVDLKDAMMSLIINNRSTAQCESKKKCIIEFYQKRIEPTLLQWEAECCPDNYFFGYLTIFDFILYEVVNHFRHIYSEGLDKLPKLVAVRDRVAAIPQIKAYEQSPRAVTEFCPIRFFNKFKQQKINACRALGQTSMKSCKGMDLE